MTISADDVLTAVQATLEEYLPDLAAANGLGTVSTWQQLPDLGAITAAKLPAGAIVTPGLSDLPVRKADGYEATWRVSVGLWDRSSDHAGTARKARLWAALIRTVLVQHRSLGGVSSALSWVAEEYALLPDRNAARTISGCEVSFDITPRGLVVGYEPNDGPVVLTTEHDLTVRD